MTELYRRQFVDFGTYLESQPSRANTSLKLAPISSCNNIKARPNRKEKE